MNVSLYHEDEAKVGKSKKDATIPKMYTYQIRGPHGEDGPAATIIRFKGNTPGDDGAVQNLVHTWHFGVSFLTFEDAPGTHEGGGEIVVPKGEVILQTMDAKEAFKDMGLVWHQEGEPEDGDAPLFLLSESVPPPLARRAALKEAAKKNKRKRKSIVMIDAQQE